MAKSNSKKKGTSKTRGGRGRTRGAEPRVRQNGPSRLTNYFLPALLSVVMLACLVGLVMLGYRTVTASEFFAVRDVDVAGVCQEDIRIVVGRTYIHHHFATCLIGWRVLRSGDKAIAMFITFRIKSFTEWF